MVIPVVAAPVLTRLYTPQDYGIFALYVSLVSVLSVPISANYDSAVMLPEQDGDALNLVALCLVIALLLSTVLLLVLWPLTGRITTLLGNRHIAAYLHLVPLMAFMLGVYQALSFWANRKRQFRWLAANKIAESLATPLLSVFLGLCSLGVGGLIWALLSGKAVAVSMLARRIWQEKRKERVPLKRALMLEQGRKYCDFPVYSAPASFLDVVALQIPVLLLTKSFGPTVVGLFALTTRVAGAPMALIAGCVAQVYYQWIAEARHREEDSPHLFKVAGYLALIVLGPSRGTRPFFPAAVLVRLRGAVGSCGGLRENSRFPSRHKVRRLPSRRDHARHRQYEARIGMEDNQFRHHLGHPLHRVPFRGKDLPLCLRLPRGGALDFLLLPDPEGVEGSPIGRAGQDRTPLRITSPRPPPV